MEGHSRSANYSTGRVLGHKRDGSFAFLVSLNEGRGARRH